MFLKTKTTDELVGKACAQFNLILNKLNTNMVNVKMRSICIEIDFKIDLNIIQKH